MINEALHTFEFLLQCCIEEHVVTEVVQASWRSCPFLQ